MGCGGLNQTHKHLQTHNMGFAQWLQDTPVGRFDDQCRDFTTLDLYEGFPEKLGITRSKQQNVVHHHSPQCLTAKTWWCTPFSDTHTHTYLYHIVGYIHTYSHTHTHTHTHVYIYVYVHTHYTYIRANPMSRRRFKCHETYFP